MRTFAWLALLCPAVAAAGGSVGFDEIEPMLRHEPALYRYLSETLDVHPDGVAVTIGRDINPRLALRRIGPYEFKARRRGESGSYPLRLVINTDTRFFDARGREVDPDKGVRVEERFASVEIGEADAPRH